MEIIKFEQPQMILCGCTVYDVFAYFLEEDGRIIYKNNKGKWVDESRPWKFVEDREKAEEEGAKNRHDRNREGHIKRWKDELDKFENWSKEIKESDVVNKLKTTTFKKNGAENTLATGYNTSVINIEKIKYEYKRICDKNSKYFEEKDRKKIEKIFMNAKKLEETIEKAYKTFTKRNPKIDGIRFYDRYYGISLMYPSITFKEGLKK